MPASCGTSSACPSSSRARPGMATRSAAGQRSKPRRPGWPRRAATSRLAKSSSPEPCPRRRARTYVRPAATISSTSMTSTLMPADLGLQAVGIAEEDAELAAEVSDGAVAGAQLHQPLADFLERLTSGGVQGEVIEAPAAEHRRLDLGLGVIRHLEGVEGARSAQGHDHHALALVAGVLGVVVLDLGVEGILVEADEAVHILGQHGDVVYAVQQLVHVNSLAQDC